MPTPLPEWMLCDPSIGAIEDGLVAPPDPVKIARNALPYGIYDVDKALPVGVNTTTGELIAIQGAEGSRKTTLALNLVRFWCKSSRINKDKLKGGKILVETLESGLTRGKYRQYLVVMEATAWMLTEHYGIKNNKIDLPLVAINPGEYRVDMSKIRQDFGKELRLSVDYALTTLRTPLQQKAIEYAAKEVDTWPLLIYGAAPKHGYTRAMRTNGKTLDIRQELPYLRWKHAIDKYQAKIIVLDHIQGFAGSSGMAYKTLDQVVDRISTIVAEEHIVFVAISQVSLGSRRDSSVGLYARGGSRLAEQAHSVLNTSYEPLSNSMTITPGKMRGKPPPTMIQALDMESGKFIGRSVPLRKKEM